MEIRNASTSASVEEGFEVPGVQGETPSHWSTLLAPTGEEQVTFGVDIGDGTILLDDRRRVSTLATRLAIGAVTADDGTEADKEWAESDGEGVERRWVEGEGGEEPAGTGDKIALGAGEGRLEDR